MKKTTATAYFRTSSAANVGNDKDSLKRQQEAVTAYAKAHKLEIVREFYDAAVSGADPIGDRAGFVEMLSYIHGNGAKIILVENASRFARDLAVQLAGHELLKQRGIDLIPVDAPDHFINETPPAVMVRQILRAVSQFEKASTVEKLRVARDRMSSEAGERIEGRKPYSVTNPEMVREAKRLGRRNPKTAKTRSLRAIAKELAILGYTRDDGTPLNAQTIKNILARG
jgi:DNA invertase Pin-like site-specific DNA recombinase